MTESATVDTELLDRVFDLISRVPAVHDQNVYGRRLTSAEEADALTQVAEAPDWAPLRGHRCGTAHCVAGWVLVLKGHPTDEVGSIYDTDGRSVLDESSLAAEYLGIDPEVAHDGINELGLFNSTTSLPEIRSWIDYFKGDLDRTRLLTALDRRDLLDSNVLGGPDA